MPLFVIVGPFFRCPTRLFLAMGGGGVFLLRSLLISVDRCKAIKAGQNKLLSMYSSLFVNSSYLLEIDGNDLFAKAVRK